MFLGIDLGTSEVKALLLDDRHGIVATTGERLTVQRPRPLWARLLASTLGVPLLIHQGGEAGGALGAARLAWLCVGGDLSAVCTIPKMRQRFEPDAAEPDLLGGRYAHFGGLCPAMRAHFHASS
jgi:sugar (pentulose or hexulose) kinase